METDRVLSVASFSTHQVVKTLGGHEARTLPFLMHRGFLHGEKEYCICFYDIQPIFPGADIVLFPPGSNIERKSFVRPAVHFVPFDSYASQIFKVGPNEWFSLPLHLGREVLFPDIT